MKHSRHRRSLILVVDHQAEVLNEVATVLAGANLACRCCTTAEEAIAAAASSPPDLIISDVHLHGHSGLDMCARIRKNAALREVPVMFLCGAQVPDIIRRSDSLGGTYYLRKPFDPDVLLELIDTALGRPQLVASHAGQRWSGAGVHPPSVPAGAS
jgi:DNA-binding response OmpR family regulator